MLKANSLGIVETSAGVTIVRSRDLVKSASPVFKEKVPKDFWETYVTLILSLPKKFQDNSIDKTLRSMYSRDGDLKYSEDGKKLIISDWASNAVKISEIINKMK